jgi:hypothetical protein
MNMGEENKKIVAFFNAAGAASEAFTATVNGGAEKIQYTAYCDEAVKDLYMKNHKDDAVVWSGPKSDFKYAGRRVTLNEEDAWQVNDALCPPPRLG